MGRNTNARKIAPRRNGGPFVTPKKLAQQIGRPAATKPEQATKRAKTKAVADTLLDSETSRAKRALDPEDEDYGASDDERLVSGDRDEKVSSKKPATKRAKRSKDKGDGVSLPEFKVNSKQLVIGDKPGSVARREVTLPQTKLATWKGVPQSPEVNKAMNLDASVKYVPPSQAQGATYLAASKGVTLDTHVGRGLKVAGSAVSGKLPAVDYHGERARQILHHHSEVLRWHLEKTVDRDADEQAETHHQANLRKREQAEKDAGYATMDDQAKQRFDQKYSVPARKIQYFAPVEVQSMHFATKGKPQLTVSANHIRSQKYLAEMTPEDVKKIYEAAANIKPQEFKQRTGKRRKETVDQFNDRIAASMSEAERARRSAVKVLNIHEQNKQRRAEDASYRTRTGLPSRENEEDLQLAEDLAAMASGGQHTVIVNRGGRHAEQNLEADRLHQARQEKEKWKEGDPATSERHDVAGTYMRCGACSAQLGYDCTHARLKERRGDADKTMLKDENQRREYNSSKNVVGEVYAKETEPATFGHVMEDIGQDRGRGRTMMFAGKADRARSRSPDARRVRN